MYHKESSLAALIIAFIFTVGLLPSEAQNLEQSKSVFDEKSRSEARDLWEKVVEAKGGRSKILSIKNIVVSSEGSFRQNFHEYKIRLEDLYVFPNKWWSWNDHRPSIFGLRTKMYDWTANRKYVVTDGDPIFRGLQDFESTDSKSTNFAGATPDLLLETKWNAPIPERVYFIKYRGKKTRAIQTSLLSSRIDFILDEKSLLPVQTVYYSADGSQTKSSFSNYVEIYGIKMPSTVIFEGQDGNMRYSKKYQFNVDFDENIFKSPPPFEKGPKGWQRN